MGGMEKAANSSNMLPGPKEMMMEGKGSQDGYLVLSDGTIYPGNPLGQKRIKSWKGKLFLIPV